MENLKNITLRLRHRLTEYRFANLNIETSTHINAIEIAVCLVEFYIESNNRKILFGEQNWFKASYYVQLVLENSEWNDFRICTWNYAVLLIQQQP